MNRIDLSTRAPQVGVGPLREFSAVSENLLITVRLGGLYEECRLAHVS